MGGFLRWLAPLLGLILPVALSAQAVLPPDAPRFRSETPTARVDYWQQREAQILRELGGTADLSPVRLVFIGDSITDFWHLDENPWFKGRWMGRQIWDESFAGADPANRAINFGVSGDRIEHVLFRLTPARVGMGLLDRPDLKPEFLIIMLGINNTFDGEEPMADSLFKGVKAVIDLAHQTKPATGIILQSILPTDDAVKNAEVVAVVNRRLKQLAAERGYRQFIHYLDLYPSFVDQSGLQKKDLFADGLHPNKAGYAVWRDALVPALAAARRPSALKAKP
jgi:lysophospholipase L1-like esterase